ncbi:hypothetical protein BSK66_24900 [Paenibacillus odorifer]|jgi:hypothetical protein|uniref:hypothetical protein n=1 Tax=Paenibacillus TaxID=44249 RepID=UPI0003E294C1|nr:MULTISPECIES: hypothetical protein [Paenibacillus]ETT54676.1 hypothetical protein C171_20244 [Paenibacillus sp. FSL H8-237]OME50705.1 hypothetical protein BSK66_24900 [Paenibacillus odorifer]SIR50111.1 hypothetical protein SAMN05880555_4007 [Paenibacillus sp. RU4X]SIR59149.1 hypothetical protein SAMN05880570_4010 [Paenibacillus sp. RU4T]
MLYAIPSGGGCFCPILPPFCYGTSPIEEGETVPELELVSKGENVFGDTYYYIRDSRGVTSHVYEGDLDAFMKKNGAKELKQGRAYQYPKRKSMER